MSREKSADGARLHPLCSRRYLEEVCLPRIAEGMARSGRGREHFDVHGGGFVVTGPDAEAVARASVRVRERIAFYGSTRTYLPILALHGLEELGLKLHTMSVRGKWQDMAAEITDEVLHIFAACSPYDGLATAVADRFGGAADSIDLNFSRTRRWACNANCWPISAASRTGSPASIRTGAAR